MATIHFNRSTSATPEQSLAALDVVVRDGTNRKGRVLGRVLGTVGKRRPAQELAGTGTAIAARHLSTGPAVARPQSMAEMC